MAALQLLLFGAKDQSTGEAVAGKYVGQGGAIVNGFPVTTTDSATANATPYAVGEQPISVTSGIYQIPDPQAGATSPSWIRVDTTGGVVGVVFPLHPYDGMSVTVSDSKSGGSFGTHSCDVGTSNTTTDLYETFPSNGTFTGPSGSTAVNSNGASVTWRYISGSPGKWKITGNN